MTGDRRTTGTAVPKIILTGTPILRTFAGMITPDDIFRITDEAAFEAAALEVFRFRIILVSQLERLLYFHIETGDFFV